ncbi:MAG TPA: hypothetical protein PKY59_02520 [Pyrinomonadaceae bacterium]|nr:hypothetical protein [Pyrinomonadaceae bacterium]
MKIRDLSITILVTGLIAGTIDILSAIFILAGGNAVGTLKYIASGAFGKAALEGGNEMVVYGALFHYFIAIFWTAFYLIVYPKLSFLKWNKWINAVVYGLLVHTIMRFAVLPFSNVAPLTFNWSGFIKNAVILMYAIGIPAVLAAEWFYKKRENS